MDIPQNAVTTLRVLAKKSRWGFGKHFDKTVADVMICDRQYIPYAYYNIPAISFSEEVLQEMEITERIAKPGTDAEAFNRWRLTESRKYTREQRFHGWMKKKRIWKRIAEKSYAEAVHSVDLRKSQLQAKNHGRG